MDAALVETASEQVPQVPRGEVMVGLLTVLGFAVAVAAAVTTGAAWKDWDVLWRSPWQPLHWQRSCFSP